MKTLITLILTLIMSFTSTSMLWTSIELPMDEPVETPVAYIENDDYVPYSYSYDDYLNEKLNIIKNDIESVGGCIESYSNEEANSLNMKTVSNDELVTSIEPTLQIITVLTTPTGSKDYGTYKESEPIRNALVRLDGVPRYTDSNGQIRAYLDKEYVELYVYKNSYNPYIEIINITGDKTIYLKKPSDDVEILSAMVDYDGNVAHVLIQDLYYMLGDEYSYMDFTITANVIADEYRLYCDGKIVMTQDSGSFEDITEEDFWEIGSKLSIQVVYEGIESEIVELNLNVVKQIEQEDICDPDDMEVDLNIDGDESARKARSVDEKPSFFGELKLDISDLMKSAFNILNKNEYMALNFTIDPRKGTIKVAIGFELERSKEFNPKLKELKNKVDKAKTKTEKKLYKKQIREIEEKDKNTFGTVYHEIAKSLKKMQKGQTKEKDKRTVFDHIKNIKNIKRDEKGKIIRGFTNAPSFNLDFQVVGVFEFNLKTKQFVDISLMAELEGHFTFSGQFLVVYVPCFWKIEIGFDLEFKITFLTEEDKKAMFKLDELLKLSFEVYAKGEIGVGFCDLLSVSGYIRLGLKFDWRCISGEFDLYGNLIAGVRLKALLWDFNWDIFDKKWKIYHQDHYKTLALSANIDDNVSNIMYEASKPVLSEFDGKKILTWVEYVNKSGNYTTALMYSVYKDGNWSNPTAVYDSNYADFDYDVYNDGNNLYITWQSVNDDINDSTDINAMSCACEIFFAEFDKDTQKFANVMQLTDDNELDCQPSFARKENSNDPLTLIWRKNTENNVLGFSGKNYFIKKTFDGEKWLNSEVFAEFSTPVSNGVGAYVGGDLKTAFIVDMDGDLLTNDQEIILVDEGEIRNLTNDPAEYSSIDFINRDNKNQLMYKSNNNLIVYDLNNNKSDEFVSKFECLDRVKYIQDDVTGLKMLYYTQLRDEVKQLYCSIYDSELNIWSDNICLTNEDSNVLEPSVYISADGKICMAYYLYDETSQLMSIKYNEMELGYGIKIESANIFEIVNKGEDFEIRFEIQNVGELPITSVNAQIGDNVQEIILEQPLLANERVFLSFTHRVNSLDIKNLNLIISAKINETILAEDSYAFSIDYVDYSIGVEKNIISGKQIFDVFIQRLSERCGNITLVVYRQGKEVIRQNIKIDEESNYQFSFDELDVDDQLKFELLTDIEDYDPVNNVEYIYSTLEEKKDIVVSNQYKEILDIAKGRLR